MRVATALAVVGVGLMLGSAARAESGAAAPGLPASVRVKPLMLPVVSATGAIEKYTQVEVTLEIADPLRLGEFQVALPKLQDAMLAGLYEAVESGWIVRGNIANANAVRRALDGRAENLLGKDSVSRVLITPVARQSAWP